MNESKSSSVTSSAVTFVFDGVSGVTSGGACFHLNTVTCPNCEPKRTSSQCPTCTPRCPHGYPADPIVTRPIVTWGGTPFIFNC